MEQTVTNVTLTDWVDILRIIDLIGIGFSTGLTIALWLRLDSLKAPYHIKIGRVLYLMTFVAFALGTMTELELAIVQERPISWRTVIVTIAATVGVSASWWVWHHWAKIRQEMREGV